VNTRHVVLLDLDGTLIDSAPGILAGLRIALAAVGVQPPDDSVMRSWIGPPVRETISRELGAQGDAAVVHANAAFREYFDAVGAHESVVYEGVPAALAAIADSGAVMSVVTHKPASLAEMALEQHGLAAFIETLHAPPSPTDSVPKETLFEAALAATTPDTVISVGDRGTDIRAAGARGIAGIGVTWGYGGVDELVGAGAASIADAPEQLPALVLGRRPG
jgi:phosphoglycolate phosphatase